MPTIREVTETCVQRRNRKYGLDEDGSYHVDLYGVCCRWHTVVSVNDEKNEVVLNSYMVEYAPVEQRANLAIFLNLINCNLSAGNFAVDPFGGEIKFRVSIEINGIEPVPSLIETLFEATQSAMNRYYIVVGAFMRKSSDMDPRIKQPTSEEISERVEDWLKTQSILFPEEPKRGKKKRKKASE